MNKMEDDPFFFETDHLALRNNKDYRSMLRYILLLESQKIRLVRDIESLACEQQKALELPFEFVNNLKDGKIDFPAINAIPEVPTIDWSQYGIDSERVAQWSTKITEPQTERSNNVLIRGRAFDQTKPETFNQLWTCEEQRRLEELLKQFPAEEIEMRRWTKIADALGNRTPKQVMSRVQKYFFKLQQAKLPVPGRMPRSFLSRVIGKNRSKVTLRQSTFFPDRDVPVLMTDCQTEGEIKVPVIEQWTSLELMQAVYERRKIEESRGAPLPVHTGISCIGCSCDNIVGTRWTDGAGSDWCSDCLVSFQPSTKLTPISSFDYGECENL